MRSIRQFRTASILAIVVSTCSFAALAATPAVAAESNSHALIAFLPNDPSLTLEELNLADRRGSSSHTSLSVLDRLQLFPQLSLGFTSATQGTYSPTQALLDMTQGTRTSAATYRPERPPSVTLDLKGDLPRIENWLAVRLRADTAPARIVPGLLASNVPGGAAFVGSVGGTWQPAILAAREHYGFVGKVSIGASNTVATRVDELLERKRLVIAELTGGDTGSVQLQELIHTRKRDELLIVMQLPPRSEESQLLATGIVGLDSGKPGELTSKTTHRDGIIAGIDIVPTVFKHLGISVPSLVKGQQIEVLHNRDARELDSVQSRLRVVGPRRLPTLQGMVIGWILLAALGGVFAGQRGIRWSGRVGALAFFWIAAVLLLAAELAPSRDNELLLIVLVTFGLGIVSDRLLPWPRAPLLPALAALLAYGIDLGMGSDLVVNSLLGPNPRSGSRFFGIGNELEALLPTLSLIGMAGALGLAKRSRMSAALFAGLGLILAVIVGAGKLGADVGGVITIGAAAAAASVLMLPGGITRKRVIVVIAIPLLGLGVLAVIDQLSGGDGHFSRTVLGAGGASDIWDIILRRSELALNSFTRDLMPLLTAICVLLIVYAIQNRQRFYAAVADRPAWRAALIGGLVGSVVGTFSNDSGPILLLFGTVILLLATVYIRCGNQSRA